jgi:hypothetical protein
VPSRALSELALCAGILADSETSEPSPAQMQKLDGLEARVLAALSTLRAAPEPEPAAAQSARLARKKQVGARSRERDLVSSENKGRH